MDKVREGGSYRHPKQSTLMQKPPGGLLDAGGGSGR